MDLIEKYYKNENLHEKIKYAEIFGWTNGLLIHTDHAGSPAHRKALLEKREGGKSLISYSVFPFPIEKRLFNKAVRLTNSFNKIVETLSCHPQWLFKKLTKSDEEFTQKLIKIAKKIYNKNSPYDLKFNLIRSDYMINQKISQIELNTISLSFGGFSQKITELHKLTVPSHLVSSLPLNNVTDEIAKAIREAHTLYCLRHASCCAAILFVIDDDESNEMDQRMLEFTINKDQEKVIKVIRKSMEGLAKAFYQEKTLQLKMNNNNLSGQVIEDFLSNPVKGARLFLNDIEISFVYYRTAYDPRHYGTENHWNVRELLEWSSAIKCPNLLTHLAGVKKIQALWNNPSDLKFCLPNSSNEEIAEVSSVFVDQIDLIEDLDSKGLTILEEGIQFPKRFILKPLREGGSNNIYGAEMVAHLMEVKKGFKKPFILMRRIEANIFEALPLNYPPSSIPSFRKCVTELGTFGVSLMVGDTTIMRKHCGHLLRTKDLEQQEGGVVVGSAFLDSPILH